MSIEGKHAYRFEYLKSEQWQNVRIEALAREKGKCQICGEESIHNDAHHKWYPSSMWETREHHLVILCRPCHDFIHQMIPECKTKNESEGKAHWTRYSNAIREWRRAKLFVFDPISNTPAVREPEPGKFVKAATLRQNYDILKKAFKECRDALFLYQEKFGKIEGIAEVYAESKAIPRIPTAKEQRKMVVSAIQKWADSYFGVEKNPVDNIEYFL